MIPIGPRVTLLNWKLHNDYLGHEDQVGTVTAHFNAHYNIAITWNDGVVSHASEKNIVIVSGSLQSLQSLQSVIAQIVAELKER